jgi:hypothetical protein
MDNKAQTVRRIILAGAVYDFLVCALLAVPPLTRTGLDILFWVNQTLGFDDPRPAYEPLHVLFITLFGLWVTAWAIVRFMSADLNFVKADLFMRLSVLVVLFWYWFTQNAYGIVYLFIAADLVLAAANYWGTRQLAQLHQGERQPA